jgi:hypothetical protein
MCASLLQVCSRLTVINFKLLLYVTEMAGGVASGGGGIFL